MRTTKLKYSVKHSYYNVVVFDKINDIPISSVSVYLSESDKSGVTDSSGRIFISDIAPEIYFVRFEAPGYFSHTQVINFRPGEIKEEKVSLVAKHWR